MPNPPRKIRSFGFDSKLAKARQRRKPLLDFLEDRTLLTSSLDSQGLLQVVGTASADTINISLNNTTQNIEVFENAVKTGAFPLNSVASIDIKAGLGNDIVSIGRGFVINSITDLGTGLDKFTGGDGDDFVKAIDGLADTVDGGLGQDGVWSDSPDHVSGIEFLNPMSALSDNQRQTVRIMVINFNPVVPSEGNKLMHEVFNWMSPQDIAVRYQTSMEKASGGAIKFDIVKWNNINEIPVFEDGFQYTPDQYVANRRSNSNWHTNSGADFRKIVRENGVVDLINSGEVDEVWCIGDHFYNLPGESWMAGPEAFWINGPVYSDIPTVRPFACMGFSYERPDTLTHNMGHRTESTMNYFYGNWNLASPKTNWDKFSGNAFQSNGYSGVGTCHYPANGESDYDYANTRTVASTADDFLNYPNLTGNTIPVSRTAWSKNGAEYQWEYLEWYFTRFPRAAGINADGRQNNWWKYLYNFNNYNTNGSARALRSFAITTDVIASTKTTQTVQVAYSGATFINRSTLDDNDIEIVAPDGTRLNARLIKISSGENGPYIVGTYEMQSPGADWSTAPAGNYRVYVKAGQVADVKGVSISAAAIGVFSVRGISATPLGNSIDTSILLPFDGNSNGSAGESPTISSNINYQSGKVGQAAYFTSSSLLRYQTANNILPAAGTIQFFLKPDWPAGTVVPSAFFQVGSSFNNSLFMQIDGAYNVRLMQWGDDPATSQIETAVERGVSFSGANWRGGNWYHVAATWDETSREIAIYSNGNLMQKSSLGLKINQFATSYFTVGTAIDGSASFKGLIDDFRISTRALSPSEIKSDFQNAFAMNSFAISLPQSTFKSNDYFTPQLIATLDDNSNRDVSAMAVWTSSDSSIAAFDSNRQIQLLKSGTVTLQAKIGSTVAQKQFTVTDGGRPTARITNSSLPTQPGPGIFQFTVEYSDPQKVLRQYLGKGDVYVSGPQSFHAHATFVSATPNIDSATVSVIYNVSAPGGIWTPAMNGFYQVQLKDWQVSDTSLNFARELNLGTLQLNVSPQTDLELIATPPATATNGTAFDFSWRAKNNGPGIAQNTILSVTLPAGIAFVSSSLPATIQGNNITVNLGIIVPGSFSDITFKLLPSTFGNNSITASISSNNIEINALNNVTVNNISINDKPGLFQFEASQLETIENTNNYQVKVLRTSGAGGAATVAYTVVAGTGSAGIDYNSPATGLLQFADGQTSATFTINLVDDPYYEGSESINLGLLNPTGGTALGTPVNCLLNIIDNETQPILTVSDVSTEEGNSPGQLSIFNVSLSGASDLTTTVRYSTLADTALAGTDFVAKSGTLVFAPRETSKQVNIEIISDQLYEKDEKFYFQLDTPGQAIIGNSRAIGTILNDDPLPVLSVADASVNELTGSSTIISVNIVLSLASTLPVTVDYVTANDSAVSPADYSATAGSLVFQPGETIKNVKIVVKGDSIYESTEKFQFVLSSAVGATITRGTALCTINDDDARPTISVNQVSIIEPDTGSTATANIIVSLSAASGLPVVVKVEPVNGTAVNGLDYLASTVEIVIPAGSIEASYPVTILGDRIHEPEKTLTVKITSVSGEPVGSAVGSVKIIDNDPQIQASIADSTIIEGNSGTSDIIFPVNLTAASEIPVSFDYYTLDGTATGGVDYEITRGTITIPAGQTTTSIRVPVIGDSKIERSSMIFNMVLNNPQGIAFSRDRATGTIRDNDSPGTFYFDKPEYQANENLAGGILRLSVYREFGDLGAIEIPYSVIEDSAKAGLDFMNPGSVLKFSDGQTVAEIAIPILNDSLVESPELFRIQLGNPGQGAVVGTPSVATVTILSDDTQPPAPTITSIVPVISRGSMSSIRITFSESMNSATAQKTLAYMLSAAGRDKKFGTRDDVKYRITRATYNTATRTVTINHTAVRLTADLQLTIIGTGTNAIKSASGNTIDGDRNGQPGGNAIVTMTSKGEVRY